MPIRSPSYFMNGNGEAAFKVMIVDDNADAAGVMALYLQTLGYEVLVAHTADRAIETAKRLAPDVCLLDIGLPDMDGKLLARKLRSLEGMNEVAMAAVTGYGQVHDMQSTRIAGFKEHFVKPVDNQKLITWLADLKTRKNLA